MAMEKRPADGKGSGAGTPTRLPSRSPLTPRVLVISLLLIPVNAWWITETEYIRYSDNVTTQSLFFNATSLLLFLIAVNGLLRRMGRPRSVFTAPELLALYMVTVVASGLAGHDTLQVLFTTIAYPVQRATTMTDGDALLRSLPPHLVVMDKEALRGLYDGNSTIYQWSNLRPWLLPLSLWSGFTLVLVWTMLCLTTLFRRRWEQERLSYPITEIPLRLIRDDTRPALLKSPLLWIGFAIGASFQIINLIHALFPSVPGASTGVHYFRAERFPWSAAGPLPLCTYAFAYGLTFLLPTQLGFSCWFFFLVSRLELVIAAMFGYTEWGKFPYVQQQGVGAVFGFFVAIVYGSRSYLKRVWDAATGGEAVDDAVDDADEPMPYKVAVWGLAVGIGLMVAFAVWAGMRPLTACLFLAILLMIVVVVARLRAELGLPTFELYQVGADQVLPAAAGTRYWTTGDYTGMSLFFYLTRTHRQFPMQSHVDAMHLGKGTGTSPLRSLTVLILVTSALGIIAAFWAFLHSTYQVGLESANFQGPAVWAFGNDPWRKWENWTRYPLPPEQGNVQAYLFGAVFTLFLSWMRARFIWWPFHPAGYLVSGSFGLFRLWLPLFVSWLIKALLLRYGGLGAYRRALPFFFGLVLGEFTAGFLRSVLDLSFGLHLPAGSGIGGL